MNDSDDDSDEEERAVKKEEQASGRGLEEMMERVRINVDCGAWVR